MSNSPVQLIDHAVLQPFQTADDVRVACELCREVKTASVCVKPCHVPLAAELLADSPVLVSTVIGFPHGGSATQTKVAEAKLACQQGAVELDMVINIAWAIAGEWELLAEEISAVVQTGRKADALTKVIFETGLLPNDEIKRRLCLISEQAGAAFVKTSTGFGMKKAADGHMIATGATEQDILLMRETCSETVGVKASGGIRTLADAQRMIAVGASRLGTSGTAAIAAEWNASARKNQNPGQTLPSNTSSSDY